MASPGGDGAGRKKPPAPGATKHVSKAKTVDKKRRTSMSDPDMCNEKHDHTEEFTKASESESSEPTSDSPTDSDSKARVVINLQSSKKVPVAMDEQAKAARKSHDVDKSAQTKDARRKVLVQEKLHEIGGTIIGPGKKQVKVVQGSKMPAGGWSRKAKKPTALEEDSMYKDEEEDQIEEHDSPTGKEAGKKSKDAQIIKEKTNKDKKSNGDEKPDKPAFRGTKIKIVAKKPDKPENDKKPEKPDSNKE